MDPLIGLTIQFDPSPSSSQYEAPRGGPGSQVLPVAEYIEDDDGVPQDGLEYLYLVRKESENAPRVSRVPNPYDSTTSPPPTVTARIEPNPALPSLAWRETFIQKFLLLQERIKLSPVISTDPLPSRTNAKGWITYINGLVLPTPTPTLAELKASLLASLDSTSPLISDLPKPEILYDPNHFPHLPTPALMRAIDQPLALSVLSHLHEHLESIEELPTTHESHWILSLFTRLDPLLEGSDIALLRSIARDIKERILENVESEEEGQKWNEEKEELAERKALGWMIVVAVAQVWKQEDLLW